jgi:hypothetical protein
MSAREKIIEAIDGFNWDTYANGHSSGVSRKAADRQPICCGRLRSAALATARRVTSAGRQLAAGQPTERSGGAGRAETTVTDSPREPDDLDRYLAEQLRDPEFAAAWRAAISRERRYKALRDGRPFSSMRSSYRSRMKARHRRG